MTLQEVLEKTTKFFKDKDFDSPRLDAELLLCKGLGLKKRMDLYLKFEQPLKEQELEACRELVKRRNSGEPVAYILGEKDFFNQTFVVNKDVLIPRPETELLVEAVLEWAKGKENLNIIDLGTGSGCIGLTLAKNLPTAKILCVDKSAEAIAVAMVNAEKLGVSAQVEFINQDILETQFSENFFDVVVSNPPYIAESDAEVEVNVKKFEPNMALFAPAEGLEYLKSWSQKFAPSLKATSFMGFEMGYTQAEDMKKHYENLQIFDEIKIVRDLSGQQRHIVGLKNG